MSGTNEDSTKLFKQLAEFPSYKAGQFQSSNVLRVTTVTSDHERLIKRTSIKTYVVTEEKTIISASPDVPEVVASSLSPSGKHLAVLREVADSTAADGKKRFVEIWTEDKIQVTHEVTSIHGAFFTDEYLSSISFSPSESKVVYTAEGKPDEPASDPLAKYRFTPDFGESYNGKKRPSVFLFDWQSDGKNKVSKLIPSDSSGVTLLGHPVFGGEDQIFSVSYEYTKDHRLLGVLACPNRHTAIWQLSLPSDAVEQNDSSDVPAIKATATTRLTPGDLSVRSPRVLYGGADGHATHLLWLSNAIGGPHATCSTLHILDLASGETKILVKPVWEAKPSEFPGLYLNTLPLSPFITITADGATKRFLAVSSGWGSRSVVLLISLEDGKTTNLTPDNGDPPYSWTVLGTDGEGRILTTRSAPNRPYELLLGVVSLDDAQPVSWIQVEKPKISEDLFKKLEELKTEIIPIPGREPVETVVVRRPTQGVQPLITMPHGGPHGTLVSQFIPFNAALAIEGYTISYPNFTGSLNFGEKHVRELLGKIGSLDVEDCIASIKHLVSLGYATEGPGQQYLLGTSHGGFLTGHLIGQYPKIFSAAVLRNPVISVGELSYSDIPDWYFEESGIPYTPTSLVTPEIYQKLWSFSPIAHVDKVECPVLLFIGEKDQRVATTQGKGYYHALKGRGKDVEMLTFKDDIHPIDSVEGTLVAYQAAKLLFGRNTSKTQ